jgi:hypothetical protein
MNSPVRQYADYMPRRSLLSKYDWVSWYTHKCNFVYDRKKSTAFLRRILRNSHIFKAYLVYQISPKSDSKCGNYGQKFIYAS